MQVGKTQRFEVLEFRASGQAGAAWMFRDACLCLGSVALPQADMEPHITGGFPAAPPAPPAWPLRADLNSPKRPNLLGEGPSQP